MATVVTGSKMSADNAYGQNGYTGASSDKPGQKTCCNFLPEVVLPDDKWQTRDVGTANVPNK